MLFAALITACTLLAGGLLVTRELVVHIASALICAAAIADYVLTRAVPLPMLAHDVGNWLDPLGLAALGAEGVVVGTCIAVLIRRRSRAQGSLVRGAAIGAVKRRRHISVVAAVGLAAFFRRLVARHEAGGTAGTADGHSALALEVDVGHQHGDTTTPMDDEDPLAEDYASQVGAHYMRYAQSTLSSRWHNRRCCCSG